MTEHESRRELTAEAASRRGTPLCWSCDEEIVHGVNKDGWYVHLHCPVPVPLAGGDEDREDSCAAFGGVSSTSRRHLSAVPDACGQPASPARVSGSDIHDPKEGQTP